MAQMTTAQVGAALDLNCMIRRLLANRGPLSTAEKAEISALSVRLLSAMNGHEPAREKIDEATARAAFEATLKAMTIAGITNAQLAAWFNGSALQRMAPPLAAAPPTPLAAGRESAGLEQAGDVGSAA